MAGAMQIASLMVKIGADLQPLNKGLGKASGMLKSAVAPMAKMAAGVALGAVAGIGAIGGAIAKLAMDAAPLEGVRTSFDNLAKSIGQDPVKAIESLREASRGMIADTDLMKSFNEAVMLAGDAMGREMPKLMQIAQAAAAATGQDVNFMLDSLVKGIGRASPMILDNLGLTIDLSDAYDAYAKSAGKVATELSKAEQQQAILNAVVSQGDDFIAKMGGEIGGTEVAMAQLGATIKNLKEGIGAAFLPVLQAVLEPLAQLAQEHGPQVTEWAKQFAGWLRIRLIPAVMDFGKKTVAFITQKVVPAFKLIITAIPWSEIVGTIGEVVGVVGAIGGAVMDTIGKIPGLNNLLTAVSWDELTGKAAGLAGDLDGIGAAAVDMGNLVADGFFTGGEALHEYETKLLGLKGNMDIVEDGFYTGGEAIHEMGKNVQGLAEDFGAAEQLYAELKENLDKTTGSLEGVGAAEETASTNWYDFLKPAWEDLQRFSATYLNPIMETTGGIFSEIDRIIKATFVPTLNTDLAPAMDTTRDWFKKVTTKIGEEISEFLMLDKVIGDMKQSFDDFKDDLRELFFFLEDWRRRLQAIVDLNSALGLGRGTSGGGGGGGGGVGGGGVGGERGAGMTFGPSGNLAGGQTVILAPIILDRRDFEDASGELDYGAIGDAVMGGRLY